MKSADTITCIYDKKEDRLRLIFNYKDYASRIDFLITRRVVIEFLSKMDSFLCKHYEVSENSVEVKVNKTQGVNKTDFSTMQVTHKDEAYLLEKIDARFDETKKETALFFSGSGKSISLSGDLKTIQNILKSIENAIPKIDWGISKIL